MLKSFDFKKEKLNSIKYIRYIMQYFKKMNYIDKN